MALSETIMGFVSLAVMITYAKWNSDISPYVSGLSSANRISMKSYLDLGVPSMLMFWFDTWIFNICVFISSYFGVIGNASQTILLDIALFLFTIGESFYGSSGSMIGEQVGKGNIKKGKYILNQMIVLITLINAVIFLTVFFQADNLLKLYTNDERVIISSVTSVKVILIGNFFDSL